MWMVNDAVVRVISRTKPVSFHRRSLCHTDDGLFSKDSQERKVEAQL